MAYRTLLIEFMDGTALRLGTVTRVFVREGVLYVSIADTAYTSRSNGYPLVNIKSWRWEDTR